MPFGQKILDVTNLKSLKQKRDLFRLCPPSLVGAYYLQPPDARAIFLHNDLLCNDTCSVTGGSITYWGGGAQTEKIPEKNGPFEVVHYIKSSNRKPLVGL